MYEKMKSMKVINLNETFCEDILQAYFEDRNIRVLEIRKDEASGKGDNYTSNLYRIFVRYHQNEYKAAEPDKEISLIVKMKPSEITSMSDITHELFRNELYMFSHILPKLEEYTGCVLAPFLIYADKESNFIVMEDLREQGYVIENRFKGLSIDHCLRAIDKMAKFHAGSVAIAEKESQLLKEFIGVCGIKKLPQNWFKMIKSSLTNLSNNIAEKWKEDEYLEIANKIRNYSDNVESRLLEVYQFDPDEFCVLNHADFWPNNIMFKNDEEGKPCNALLIDFQLISYTSPAIDLQHFLAMCPELEIKGDKDDYFLETYLSVLEKSLKELECKTNPPTMDQLKEAMFKRRFYSVVTGLIYYPKILSDQEDVESIAEMLDSGTTKLDVFKNPVTVDTLRKFTKILNDKGYLD